jgi:translation elongation factor EF-Tu-like GTPase
VSEGFRFRVREAFDLAGRGTTVVGYIESGSVRAGDDLSIGEGDRRRTVRCADVAGIREADWQPGEDAAVGLLIPELAVADVSPGQFLTRS